MIEWLSRIQLNRKIWGNVYVTGSVMDIGCGLEPQRFFKPELNILCEPHHPYAEFLASRLKGDTYEIREISGQEIAATYPDNMVDSIFMLDVLEHIEKEEGQKILESLPRIARKQVVIRVPLGFVEQDYTGMKDPWGFEDSESQTHLSGWTPDDFDSSWHILACKKYQYIEGNGAVLKQPDGSFYAIKNIMTDNLEPVRLSPARQLVISLYDCGIILSGTILRLLPEKFSRILVRGVIRTVWRRLGA
ncbi:MAG: hypothetical protein JW712_05850 [Dehalococcoidales bacterium]|nr:hypothetical protein [Dehalococcoidales bacterium]